VARDLARDDRQSGHTFVATIAYRKKALWWGLGGLVGSGAIAAALALLGATTLASWAVGAGAIGYLVSAFAAMVPRDVMFSVEPGVLRPSWRRAIHIDDRELALGEWLLAGADTSFGSVLHVGGDGEMLRIGGEGHDPSGYELRGAATRTVDCHLPAGQFEELLAALGLRRGVVGPLVVPLQRSMQTIGGSLRMMAPWFVTLAACALVGVGVGATEAGARFYATQVGMFAITGVIVAFVIGGIVVTMLRSRRIRAPELELRFEPTRLVLARVDDGPELASAPWSAVTAEPRRYRMRTRSRAYPMPVLALALDQEKLLVGVWDHRRDWVGDVPRSRSARWLVGTARWSRLLAALREHGCLPAGR
jgi:hypothetical protein